MVNFSISSIFSENSVFISIIAILIIKRWFFWILKLGLGVATNFTQENIEVKIILMCHLFASIFRWFAMVFLLYPITLGSIQLL